MIKNERTRVIRIRKVTSNKNVVLFCIEYMLYFVDDNNIEHFMNEYTDYEPIEDLFNRFYYQNKQGDLRKNLNGDWLRQ